VRVWGRGFRFDDLVAIPARAGEARHGETSRLAALATRIWLPVLGQS
jgi:hypothetical protein